MITHPLIDLHAGETPVALVDRDLVALTFALADAVARCAAEDSRLTIVTPAASRITWPLRTLVLADAVQWLARTDDGDYYDATSGTSVQVSANGIGVDRAPPDGPGEHAPHDSWLRRANGQSEQRHWSVTVQHRASARLRLIGADALCREITGHSPTGWGTAEPASQAWDIDAVTAFARSRAPAPTRITVVGRDGFIAVVSVSRNKHGVQELITAAGRTKSAAGTRDDEILASLAGRVQVAFAAAQRRFGRADLTTPARFESLPVPTTLVLGPRVTRQLGFEVLDSAPIGPPRRIGQSRVPAALWSMDPDPDVVWQRLDAFVRHIGTDRLRDLAPGLAPLSAPKPGP